MGMFLRVRGSVVQLRGRENAAEIRAHGSANVGQHVRDGDERNRGEPCSGTATAARSPSASSRRRPHHALHDRRYFHPPVEAFLHQWSSMRVDWCAAQPPDFLHWKLSDVSRGMRTDSACASVPAGRQFLGLCSCWQTDRQFLGLCACWLTDRQLLGLCAFWQTVSFCSPRRALPPLPLTSHYLTCHSGEERGAAR
jgi:hypothetical protein